MTHYEHEDLSDGELYARLTQRGVSESYAYWLMLCRDYQLDEIDKILGEE